MTEADASERDAAWLRSFRRRVVAWYAKQGRDLPFRRTRDPYRIWVSEVMLQQTTVAAVVPYYERFLARFPTIAALAEAPEHEVLRLWEGLGYYRRARNMHAAAKLVVTEQGGEFPRTAAEIMSLKGIGRYTAGAIASFAFDEPAPIVEANTLRLYCRLLAYRGDPRSTAGQRRLWQFAASIMPRKAAGRFNHALMDLGATICTPKSPKCETCPVRQNCHAFSENLQDVVPLPKARPAVTDVMEAYLVVRRGGDVLVRRRETGERWAGLWDFPRYELPSHLAAECPAVAELHQDRKRLPLGNGTPSQVTHYLRVQLRKQTSLDAAIGEAFAEIRHGVTRFRIRVVCFEARFKSGALTCEESLRWVSLSDLESLALSRSGRRLADSLTRRGTPVRES
ncbi:MAG: A/G-specific adenine glycosylase [Planctomycetota bacterium]|nr:A/G-specific adenine glycosylase [Planctomycetaceae bacterium]MDQ3329613.1 A/G-specific adenine glycosylase [Planctomycetota bacterium]